MPLPTHNSSVTLLRLRISSDSASPPSRTLTSALSPHRPCRRSSSPPVVAAGHRRPSLRRSPPLKALPLNAPIARARPPGPPTAGARQTLAGARHGLGRRRVALGGAGRRGTAGGGSPERAEAEELVNTKESGEPDLQENTDPTYLGREKKKGSGKKKERTKKRASSALDSTIGSDTVNEGKSEYNLDEPTMEEKLATLNLINKDKEKNDTEEQSLSMAPPSADSVHILLKQALRADDNVSLINCLYNRDEKVIMKSISLLTPADVVKLLKFFVLQIQARGAVLVCLLPWLQTLLSRHMSSIVSQESSLSVLNSLYQLIDARTSTFKSALQLSTTLDYLFSEIADDEADEEEATPLIIYEDKDTDDEESEVDAMETDDEADELGDVTDASEHSDGSEIMSD
ncbi:hypothetical protein ACP4OV_027500 [Aristida adscensionis]